MYRMKKIAKCKTSYKKKKEVHKRTSRKGRHYSIERKVENLSWKRSSMSSSFVETQSKFYEIKRQMGREGRNRDGINIEKEMGLEGLPKRKESLCMTMDRK